MNVATIETSTSIEPDRDLSTVRKYELGYNNIYIQREDPFGFWYIRYEKGNVPDNLSGAYTSPSQAEGVLFRYLEDKNKVIAGVETHKIKSKTT